MKFAFVTPRYGADIPSGPEHACRLMAEHACHRHAIEVLTTCARNPRTWHNEYSEGTDRVQGVAVRRFAVNQPRDEAAVQALGARIASEGASRADEQDWIRYVGPSSPGLIDHLKRQARSYDAVVFFSLQNAITVAGVAAVPERSIVFPHLRLSPTLRFGVWRDILESAAGVGYISSSERLLAHQFVRARPSNEEVVGIGVEAPVQQSYPRHQQNPEDEVSDEDGGDEGTDRHGEVGYLTGRGVPFRRRHRLYGMFSLYGGRVQADNGCEELLEYFDGFAATTEGSTLVLTGVKLMTVPAEPYLRTPGVVPDRERMNAYEAAEVTFAPDPEDLLAQPVLESMAVGTPVLASARNPAAVELCRSSNAGLYYANRAEFVEALQLLMGNAKLRERMGANGREYVRLHHRWEVVISRLDRLITKARSGEERNAANTPRPQTTLRP